MQWPRVILIWTFSLNNEILNLYHLFSCSICHADHKNVVVFKCWLILDLPGIFSKNALKLHCKFVKKFEMSITRSKIFQICFSFAYIASFHVCFWYIPRTPIFVDHLSTYYNGQNGQKWPKWQFWPSPNGHKYWVFWYLSNEHIKTRHISKTRAHLDYFWPSYDNSNFCWKICNATVMHFLKKIPGRSKVNQNFKMKIFLWSAWQMEQENNWYTN